MTIRDVAKYPVRNSKDSAPGLCCGRATMNTTTEHMGRIKEGCQQIAAGGSAGLVEVSMMHPLDLIKTRLQVGGHYAGLTDCVRKTYRSEGIFSFYKGILPPLLAETPKRATKFFTFEQYQAMFRSPSIHPAISISLAGCCSGLTEAVLVCPFEVVKVRLQSERHISIQQQRSTAAIARDIIRTEGFGLNGLYLALPATLARHGLWNMIYFGMYHNMKPFIPDPKKEPAMNLAGRIVLGFSAGVIASVANIPCDVAKSRIQGPQPNPGVRKYSGLVQTMSLVCKEEGLGALYKGLVPKLLRLGPGGAIMLIVYESVYDWLKKHT